MEYPELKKYIVEQEKRGVTRALIRESLITRGGWREDFVIQAFDEIDKGNKIVIPSQEIKVVDVPIEPVSMDNFFVKKDPVINTIQSSPKTLDSTSLKPINTPTPTPTLKIQDKIVSVPEQITEKPVVLNTLEKISSIDKTMNPIEVEKKLDTIDSLYTARTVSQTEAIKSDVMPIINSNQSFSGMPINTLQNNVNQNPPSTMKKVFKFILFLIILAGISFGGFYVYKNYVKPEAFVLTKYIVTDLSAKDNFPFVMTIDMSGVVSSTGNNDEKNKIIFDGKYQKSINEIIGNFTFVNNNKENFVFNFKRDNKNIVIGSVAEDTNIRSITKDKNTSISSDIDQEEESISFVESVEPELIPFIDFYRTTGVLFANKDILSDFSNVYSFANVLQDETIDGHRTRHVLLDEDAINKISSNKKILSNDNYGVKSIEIWTTWYPVTVSKINIVFVNKNPSGSWGQSNVSIVLKDEFKNSISFTNTLTLQDYLNKKQTEEILKNQSVFFDTVFAHAELYQTNKKSYKGFCLFKTGLQDLLVDNGLFSKDSVKCADSVLSFAVAIPDKTKEDQKVSLCRDSLSAEQYLITSPLSKPQCK